MSYIGANKIGGMHLGSTKIAKAYLGSDLIFSSGGNKPNLQLLYAPADWDISKESVDIIDIFNKSTITNKRYIFTVDDDVTSIPNSINYLDSPTRFYETINGEEVVSTWNRGTNIVPTAGSTRRYAIVSGRKYRNGLATLQQATWAYIGSDVVNSFTGSVAMGTSTFRNKVITASEDVVISSIETNFAPGGNGILDLPNTITYLGYSFNATNCVAIVCRSINPPTGGSTVGAYSNINCDIFVPDDSVEDYKIAARFSAYASKIKPISTYNRNDFITT